MLEYIRRRREDDQGFTLIELMVVVLIIAILIAIAIPTFLGAQDRARNRAAQSEIRNALTAAEAISTDFEGYWKTTQTCAGNAATDTANFISQLQEEEGSVTFVAMPPAEDGSEIGVLVDNDCNELTLTRGSAAGGAFCIGSHREGDTGRAEGDAVGDLPDYAACGDPNDDW